MVLHRDLRGGCATYCDDCLHYDSMRVYWHGYKVGETEALADCRKKKKRSVTCMCKYSHSYLTKICRASVTVVLHVMSRTKVGKDFAFLASHLTIHIEGIGHANMLSRIIIWGGFAGGGACVEILVLQS